MKPADMLAEARRLVLAAGRHPESREHDTGIVLSAAGLAEQIRIEEDSHRRVLRWVAEQREAERDA